MCSLLHIGGYSISLWLVFQITGIALAGIGVTWLNHRRYGDWKVQPDVALWIFLAMLAGARIAFVLQNGRPLREALDLFTIGYVATGGIPAVLLTIAVYARFHGIGYVRLLDVIAPFAALAELFGHVGCFMAGCCFGSVTDSFFGVQFPFESHAYYFHLHQGWIGHDAVASLPIHPVQLYNAGISLVVYVVLLSLALKNPKPSVLILAYLFCHGLQRFIIQFFRGNHVAYIFGLRLPQFAALLLCIVVTVIAVYMVYQNRRRENLCKNEN